MSALACEPRWPRTLWLLVCERQGQADLIVFVCAFACVLVSVWYWRLCMSVCN